MAGKQARKPAQDKNLAPNRKERGKRARKPTAKVVLLEDDLQSDVSTSAKPEDAKGKADVEYVN